MAFSLRLDPQTEAKIRKYADATGRTKGAVVREALEFFMAAGVRQQEIRMSTLQRLRPFAGIISTGGQFSTDTHTKYRAAVHAKHRGRRSR